MVNKPGDNLWRDLWEEVMVVQPDLVQIISWNDFGESHYIGPLPKGDYKAFEVGKAPYDYITGMPHDAWRKLLPYWIDTYKKGKASISEELVVGWYRPNPAAACNSGGTSGNTAQQLQIEFDPAEVAQDIIVFSAVLASDASISVMVGGVALPAKWENKPSGGVGVYHGSVAYGGNRGAVKITISRSGNTIASFTGTDITTSCPDGYTNWNAWWGVPQARSWLKLCRQCSLSTSSNVSGARQRATSRAFASLPAATDTVLLAPVSAWSSDRRRSSQSQRG